MPQTEHLSPSAKVPPLSTEEIDDAAFRASDLAWSVVLDEFTKQQEEAGLTYKALGDRICRSKSQVQRWLSSPFSMNIRSLGLLAEGLGVDLEIDLKKRSKPDPFLNYSHPAEQAKAIYYQMKLIDDVLSPSNQVRTIAITTNQPSKILTVSAKNSPENTSSRRSFEWETAIG